MNKKILFMLFVSIGSVAVAISVYYSLGVANVAEYVALFTSVSTAIYTILAEPKAKTEPILRITPTLESHGAVFIGNSGNVASAGLNVWVENIGYSIAKDIKIRCQLIPDASIPLKDNGVYRHSLLAPKEIVQFQVVEYAERERLLSQQLIIEVSYSSEDDKKQKPIKKEYPIRELEQGFREVKTS